MGKTTRKYQKVKRFQIYTNLIKRSKCRKKPVSIHKNHVEGSTGRTTEKSRKTPNLTHLEAAASDELKWEKKEKQRLQHLEISKA
jgi:hypothetical protein